MVTHLPALQTLRAFEAAARHASFSRAAEELSLTHGAVSHHVAKLEKNLGGVRLFIRGGQGMVPTEAGHVLAKGVRAGLLVLTEAMEAVRTVPSARVDKIVLRISVLPSFASRWLVPRLIDFYKAHPGVVIDVHTQSTLATVDRRDGIDLAVRYGPGKWSGLQSRRLMPSVVRPFCSPSYKDRTGISSQHDLSRVILLRSPLQRWRPWFLAAGMSVAEPSDGPIYDDAGLLLQAAVSGQGVALSRSVLAEDDVAAGRLVSLSDVSIEDDYSWFLVWREPFRCDRSALLAFMEWLENEAKTGVGGDDEARIKSPG